MNTAMHLRPRHRDDYGIEIEYPQEHDPTRAYLHYVSTNDDGTLTTTCGTTRPPVPTDYLGPHSAGLLICSRCYLETIFQRSDD